MNDADIIAQYPEVLCVVTIGYRWLPLRMALNRFSAMGADTLLMNPTGLLVRIKPGYHWYGWAAADITSRRGKGLYANTLYLSLYRDISTGRAVYQTRPDFEG